MAKALTMHKQPKTFKRYVDDSHAHFTSKHHANIFQEILNKQDPAIQYTIEYENENKSLIFLDINITNTINNKYKFKVHHKKGHYQHTYQTNIVHRHEHHQKYIQRFPSQSTLDMFPEIYQRRRKKINRYVR